MHSHRPRIRPIASNPQQDFAHISRITKAWSEGGTIYPEEAEQYFDCRRRSDPLLETDGETKPNDCPKSDSCNAPICPLDSDWRLR